MPTIRNVNHGLNLTRDFFWSKVGVGRRFQYGGGRRSQSQSTCLVWNLTASSQFLYDNRMAWQYYVETLVEIGGTLADIRGTTKQGIRCNFPKHEFNKPVCLEGHHYLLACHSNGFHHICNIKCRLDSRYSPQNIFNAKNFNPHKKPISRWAETPAQQHSCRSSRPPWWRTADRTTDARKNM